MPSSKLTELVLTHRSGREKQKTEATDFFLELGVPASGIVYSEWKSRFKAAVYTPSSALASRAAQKARTLARGWTFEKKILRKPDWFDKWKKTYRTSPLGRKFAVVPVWEKEAYAGRRIPVFIDPQAAFGSGTHETTKLMVRLMEEAGSFRGFFDVGVGTGILSVAAARLGASRIEGIDNDAGSVRTARFNLKLNGVSGAAMKRGDIYRLKPESRFELVAANMISKVLLETQGVLARSVKAGGRLIVSGIHLKNFPSFLREFRGPGLKRLRVLRGRSWGAALYKKTTG
ncbi:MAG TPA: 50S ribosomal protein L11 methyltransferase [Verrucomicrobiae bacterium]|nr:50S ribosomal protein L11 methyltransferase [Verrucomicrobiae bacterium]